MCVRERENESVRGAVLDLYSSLHVKPDTWKYVNGSCGYQHMFLPHLCEIEGLNVCI